MVKVPMDNNNEPLRIGSTQESKTQQQQQIPSFAVDEYKMVQYDIGVNIIENLGRIHKELESIHKTIYLMVENNIEGRKKGD